MAVAVVADIAVSDLNQRHTLIVLALIRIIVPYVIKQAVADLFLPDCRHYLF